MHALEWGRKEILPFTLQPWNPGDSKLNSNNRVWGRLITVRGHQAEESIRSAPSGRRIG